MAQCSKPFAQRCAWVQAEALAQLLFRQLIPDVDLSALVDMLDFLNIR